MSQPTLETAAEAKDHVAVVGQLGEIMSTPNIATASNEQTAGGRLVPAPFIIGVGRSGTTLLRTMLAAHPDLAIPLETHFIARLARKCEQADNPWDYFLDEVTSSSRWSQYQIDRALLEERIAAIVPFDLTEALRTFYKLHAERLGKPRWGDKTPRYVIKMLIIQRVLPEAHFIHIIRDGRDVALSVLEQPWGPATIEEAATWWVTSIREGWHQAKAAHAYMEVHYEQLLLETQSTLQ
ncbi:MAG: Sulfotransferase domain superfamily, partial [uncultured Chloroflexia bacterium]